MQVPRQRVIHVLVWLALWLGVVTYAVRAGGPAWQWLTRPAVFSHALAAVENEVPIATACNVAHFGGTPADVLVVGNSAALLAIDPTVVAAHSRSRETPAEVCRLWVPQGNALATFLLTQQVLPDSEQSPAPDVLVLALSPEMTVGSIEPEERRSWYGPYIDWSHRMPELESYGADTPQWTPRAITLMSDIWPLFRYRDALRTMLRGAGAAIGPQRNRAVQQTAQVPWLRSVDTARFGATRDRFVQTQDIRDYFAGYEVFPPALQWALVWRAQAQVGSWRAPNRQWAALEAWADRVQGAGITPAITILPHNSIFTTEQVSAVLGLPSGERLIDAALYETWRADVAQFCARQDIALFDHFDALPVEAFYDQHHVRLEYREQYSRKFAQDVFDRYPPSGRASNGTAHAHHCCPW